MKKLLTKIKENQHLIVIAICCLFIGIFWTYLLLQQEIRNSLYSVYSNVNLDILIISFIGVSMVWLINKLKEFRQELFDKIEREHANTISYLRSNLTEQINYSTKVILQESLKK